MKISKDLSERAKIVTKSGRVYYAHNQEMLDALPPDIVQELARREMVKLQEIRAKRDTK